jgi:hypothetical protein
MPLPPKKTQTPEAPNPSKERRALLGSDVWPEEVIKGAGGGGGVAQELESVEPPHLHVEVRHAHQPQPVRAHYACRRMEQ